MNKNNIMFSLIKQVFRALLSFCRSLATKYLSLNNKPCMITDLSPFELTYYPFMISLANGNRSCNS